jgi:hypothetical protein
MFQTVSYYLLKATAIKYHYSCLFLKIPVTQVSEAEASQTKFLLWTPLVPPPTSKSAQLILYSRHYGNQLITDLQF